MCVLSDGEKKSSPHHVFYSVQVVGNPLTPHAQEARGFTLIELMVVVTVIGILAAIAVPNYFMLKARASEASVKANMHSVQLAVEEFNTFADGKYPGDLDTRICDVSDNPSAVSLAAGARMPPFPALSLFKAHCGFKNPFNQNDNVIDNLLVGPPPPTPPGPPAGPCGCTYYSAYLLDGVSPAAHGQTAYSYKVTAYGAKNPIPLVLP
jgi:prepilin-type N-terminal cleavage/methylation domain-containing protein